MSAMSSGKLHGQSLPKPPTANVLFVCTGNICRSPTAECVFRTLVARARLDTGIAMDSAATHDSQIGQPPDPRAISAARRRGYTFGGHLARQVQARDFIRFNWILAMDRHNLAALRLLQPETYDGRLALFLDFAPQLTVREVPDPYLGTPEDFERVLDMAERGAAALLDAVRAELALRAL
jgi:protein-tyrosine phosphatase